MKGRRLLYWLWFAAGMGYGADALAPLSLYGGPDLLYADREGDQLKLARLTGGNVHGDSSLSFSFCPYDSRKAGQEQDNLEGPAPNASFRRRDFIGEGLLIFHTKESIIISANPVLYHQKEAEP